MSYPCITKAMLEMAYDNGAVNREQGERMLKRKLNAWLVDQDHGNLARIELFLLSLTAEELGDLCSGDEEAQYAVLAKADKATGEATEAILTAIFDEVL